MMSLHGGAVPGVIVVWSGSDPALRVFRLSDDGLVLGRELMPDMSDTRISGRHTRVCFEPSGFLIEDLGSRNGTFVNGQPILEPKSVRSTDVVRCGRTIAVVLDDVRPFENVTVARSHGAIIGSRTRALWDVLTGSARKQQHVVLVGAVGTGRGHLARAYAEMRSGASAVFDVDRLGPDLQTLIVDDWDTLADADQATILSVANQGTTSIVMTASQHREPLEAWRRLDAICLPLPSLRDRPDELVVMVDATLRALDPTLKVHPSVIEQCLAGEPGAGALIRHLELTVKAVRSQGRDTVRGDDLIAGVDGLKTLFPGMRYL